MIAASCNRYDIVAVLMKYDSVLDLQDDSGNSTYCTSLEPSNHLPDRKHCTDPRRLLR